MIDDFLPPDFQFDWDDSSLPKPEETACHTCQWKDKCEFAYDPYNVDVEPGVDCLDAK